MTDPTHGPIVEDQRELMNALAHGIDEMFNPPGQPKQVVFVLLTAKFADYDDGRVNYISNGEREDCIAMMKETVARFEGRVSQEEGRA